MPYFKKPAVNFVDLIKVLPEKYSFIDFLRNKSAFLMNNFLLILVQVDFKITLTFRKIKKAISFNNLNHPNKFLHAS